MRDVADLVTGVDRLRLRAGDVRLAAVRDTGRGFTTPAADWSGT